MSHERTSRGSLSTDFPLLSPPDSERSPEGFRPRGACPELKNTSLSSLVTDDLVPAWPDSDGKIKGRAIEPLHAGVPIAIQTNKELYCSSESAD